MDIKEQLHQYLDWNWNIIPIHSIKNGKCSCGKIDCSSPGKHPLLSDWKAFQEEKVTHEQLNCWLDEFPGSNYAVITGKISDLVVIDIDGETGAKSFKEHISEFPTTRISKTGKGYHLYYKYPIREKRVKNAVGIYDGIDVRADGGYVLIPPSSHISGRNYEWINQDPLAKYKPIIPIRQEEGVKTQWAEILSKGAKKGQRNDTLSRLAGHFARMKMPYNEFLVIAEEWNEKCEPPLSREEILSTIDSIYGREGVSNAKTMEVVSLDKLMTSVYNIGWLIQDIWIRENVGWIVGAAKTGKTWLGLDMGISIASGLPFLNTFEVKQEGPVLMVLEEDTAAQLQVRIGKVMYAKEISGRIEEDGENYKVYMPKRLPIYFMVHQGFMFESEKFEELEQKIKAIKPVMVIFDPFFRMCQGFDEYRATDAMVNVLNPISRIRYENNCAMAVIHHSSKHASSSRGGERIYGSMAFHAWSESSMYLSTGKNGGISIEREFKSAPSNKALIINLGNLDETFKPEVILTGTKVEQINLVNTLADFPQGITAIQLSEKTGQSLRTVQYRIRKMVEEKRAVKEGNLYKLTDGYSEI